MAHCFGTSSKLSLGKISACSTISPQAASANPYQQFQNALVHETHSPYAYCEIPLGSRALCVGAQRAATRCPLPITHGSAPNRFSGTQLCEDSSSSLHATAHVILGTGRVYRNTSHRRRQRQRRFTNGPRERSSDRNSLHNAVLGSWLYTPLGAAVDTGDTGSCSPVVEPDNGG